MLKKVQFPRLHQRDFFKTVKNVTETNLNNIKSFESIPRPPQLPFLGNWHLYKLGIYDAAKHHEVLCEFYQRYGPVVFEKIGWKKPVVHVFEPEDVETVYRNEDKSPYTFPLLETTHLNRKTMDMSLGLGHTNGETWYKLKNGVKHLMMQSRSMREYIPIIQMITDELIEIIKLRQGKNYQLESLCDILGKWSQETSGAICFDTRLGYLGGPNEDLGQKIMDDNKVSFYMGGELKFALPFYKYISTPKWKKLTNSERFIYGVAKQYLADAFKRIDEGIKNKTLTGDQFPFLTNLLHKEELNQKDVTTIIISLFTDGLSTTVPILQNNLYCLATNQQVQEKAYQEICSVVKDDKQLTAETLNRLPFLKAIIKETFRMYPNGAEVARINQKPLILSGYHIPAQVRYEFVSDDGITPKRQNNNILLKHMTCIALNPIVQYRSEKYFSEPNVFKPERWERGVESNCVNPFILTPFGHGARTCTGRKFAELSLYISLLKILQNFKLSYPEDEPPLELVCKALLFPSKELPIRFIPRK